MSYGNRHGNRRKVREQRFSRNCHNRFSEMSDVLGRILTEYRNAPEGRTEMLRRNYVTEILAEIEAREGEWME